MEALKYVVDEDTLNKKLSERSLALTIKDSEICFGLDLKDIITCSRCKNVVIEPIKECAQCSKLYCGPCSSLVSYCCLTAGPIVKNMNRICKELAFNKVKFRHVCRPSFQFDPHLLDSLFLRFQIYDIHPEVLNLLLHELNIKEGLTSKQRVDLRSQAKGLKPLQKMNLQNMIQADLWVPGGELNDIFKEQPASIEIGCKR